MLDIGEGVIVIVPSQSEKGGKSEGRSRPIVTKGIGRMIDRRGEKMAYIDMRPKEGRVVKENNLTRQYLV